MTIIQKPLNHTRMLDRQDFFRLINLAFSQGEYHFASQVALDWITEFPGDLPMRYWYGKSRAAEGHLSLGASILDEILQADPAYLDAVRTRLEIELTLPKQHAKKQGSSTPRNNERRNITDYNEWLIALGAQPSSYPKRPYGDLSARWGEELYALRQELQLTKKHLPGDSLSKMEYSLHELMANKPTFPLIAIELLKTQFLRFRQNDLPLQGFRSLVEHYQTRFPQCLFINYLQVDILIESGEPEKAVALLHSLVARDLSAQVARQVWEADHQYLSIWPEKLSKPLQIQIPASIAAILGLNRLPEEIEVKSIPHKAPASKTEQDATPSKNGGMHQPDVETPQQPSRVNEVAFHSPQFTIVRESLNRLGEQLRKPELVNLDGRFPLYVILSSKDNLTRSFGQSAAERIEQAILKFLGAIHASKGWNGFLYYVDQGQILPHSPKLSPPLPVKQNDPWAVKRCLHELDTQLAKLGEMIGALLIIGGDEIIPFHRLPNPIEDGDDDVPSDNPYGSRDENYLVMDWPVGRLPCPPDNPDFLLSLLAEYTAQYEKPGKKSINRTPVNIPFEILFGWVKFLISLFNHKPRSFSSFGYTAASWRIASFSVFNEIGQPQSMLISPQWKQASKSAQAAKRRLVRHTTAPVALYTNQTTPLAVSTASLELTENVKIPTVTAGYFNLHGIAESAEWFGQSDPTESGFDPVDQPDHPVALQPGDILLSHDAKVQIILSEACFGAHILNKSVEESIALSFLQKGCKAFVGSTCTAYGSNDTPLIAADFLAAAFWRNVRQGYPAGEALRLAKMTMAETFSRTNNALDAEDQKTIISFVLYGDPLTQAEVVGTTPKVLRHAKHPFVISHHTCDHAMQSLTEEQISPQMEAYVKKLVERYLPGMEQARVEVLSEEDNCQEKCPDCKIRSLLPQKPKDSGRNGNAKSQPVIPRKVIILSKQVRWQGHTYTRYGRLTLGANGKVLKVAVSK